MSQENISSKPWRRLYHLVGGSFFPILALFIPGNILIIAIGILTSILIGWEITRFSFPGVNYWMMSHLGLILKPQERFRPIGTTYLLLSSLVVFCLFENYIAITSLLFLSVGDFMAAVIGNKLGRHRIHDKSLEGSLACLISCLLTAIIMSAATTEVLPLAAVIGAVSATITEFLPIPIDDNLTIPLVSAGLMTMTTFYLG